MEDNAFVKIGTALLKHQVKKLVGEEALGAIGEELADIGGDKLDAWLGNQSTATEIEKAAATAHELFHGKINDDEIEQWMVMLPIHDLPAVLSAIEELPTSPDETKLEYALREAIEKTWKNLSQEQISTAVDTYLFSLRSALLPLEKQTLMVIGREVLRTGEKVDLLVKWFEEYIINTKNDLPQNIKRSRIKKPASFTTKKYDEEVANTDTIIKEGKILQIVVSQMFRLADLLSYPESVKAKKFYEAITDSNKYRRLLNRKQGFEIPSFGVLRPITTIDNQYDDYWRRAIPNLRKEVDPLRFIPFELDLTNHLKNLKPDPGSILESVLRGKLDFVLNIQIGGYLRIYPPGTGIIKMSMTLEFREGVHLELSAELSRYIEGLLFIDPNNPEYRGVVCEAMFLEIIKKVAETFFKDEMFIGAERRWQPPETMFNFLDFHGNNLENNIVDLARLMSYAPANKEKVEVLEKRIIKTLKHPHWERERIFSVVGQGVALVIIPVSEAIGKRENQKKLMNAFVNTRELITAASYAIESYAERIEKDDFEKTLNNNLESNDLQVYDDLYNILYNMKRVLHAVLTIHEHLHNLQRGELMFFAKNLWSYDNPVNVSSIYKGLSYILENLPENRHTHLSIEKIRDIIPKIMEMPFLFSSKRNGKKHTK